ncbi:hypothetical protein ASC89_14265 [Devosia sp. Root413D1]|uniref:HdeD family acid-resistance protein n=1 Tax=unclassified Devosia TaxID=196773 RepID=UPI0006F6CFF8|nr:MULTISPECIES: HdeD family acid-resistance protein [unclassified Devosia]KQU95599.1 hypothetical protein ASC68_15505 [Devosia sp. Root105]KQW77979.1 hypothetical protein ASC89_14265 [Devosia sp. Root413D1]
MESITLEQAAEAYRTAMHQAVRKYALVYIAEAILLIVAGLLAMLYPLLSGAAIAVPLGWLLIATAALQGVALFGTRQMPHSSLQLLSIVIALLVGILLLRNPAQAREVITMLVIVYLMVQGVARLTFGFTIRPFENWLWVVLSGVLGVALSLLLIASLPEPPVWVIALFVGLELIGEGGAMLALAWKVVVPRGAQPAPPSP